MSQFLIVGQGSMGKRRVRCLLANGVAAGEIAVHDARPDRLSESVATYGVRAAGDFAAALADPATRAVFVSVPGALHVQYCVQAARAGKHWFCEVPLALGLEGLDELFALTRSGIVGAPGCQILFHPLARALAGWSRSTGPILCGSYSFGSYLPDWHAYEDYRGFYASDQRMGGGNLDVVAQELTWLRWVFDRPIEAVTCRQSKIGRLELAPGTPSHQELIVEFGGGAMLSMHFDLNDRTHERWMRLAVETATAKWSTLEPVVRFYSAGAGAGAWSEERLPEGFSAESVYHQEVAQFLRSIETGEPWPVALETAREIVTVLAAMRRSADERRTVPLEEMRR